MGPHFFNEFKAYMQENGINHQKITPWWPQANSEAENFMNPLTKAICSAHAEGRDWKKDLYQFMLKYRATPHCTTDIAPSELLFNRKIQTKLPQIENDTTLPDFFGPDDDTGSEEDDIPSHGNPQPNVFPRNPVHPERDIW